MNPPRFGKWPNYSARAHSAACHWLIRAGNLTGIVTASDLIEQGRPLHIPTVISLFDWVIPTGE